MMAELPFQPFGGAEKDAEAYRRALESFYKIFPEDTVMGDPARRAKAGKSAEHVAELTAQLAVIARVAPGFVGRLFASAIAGVEKEPASGKVGPTSATATNFLPAPFGFMDPTSVGLQRNFYLPSGSTRYIPPVADRLGIGLPEQRKLDDAAHFAGIEKSQREALERARGFVALETTDTLEKTLRRDFRFGDRASVLQSRFSFTKAALDFAINEELERRRIAALPPAPPLTPEQLSALRQEFLNRAPQLIARLEAIDNLTEQQKRVLEQLRALQLSASGGLNPFAAGAPNASIHVSAIVPFAAAALRNLENARGINRELVHERADP